MSTALLIRDKNPDDDFVLHGGPPLYTERTFFYPTNSDITTTTKKLSQHQYRADLYRDVLQEEEDHNLRSSLRSMARSLRLVSGNIRNNLEEESTAKSYLRPSSRQGTLVFKDELQDREEGALETYSSRAQDPRRWLTQSEWNTSSGHHVAYDDNVARTTVLNKEPSATTRMMSQTMAAAKSLDNNEREAERLWRTVNVDMDMAEVPLTRFTRKDLMASEYFPITMSCSGSERSSSVRRSRPRTRSPQRLAQSARMRALSSERTPVTDNFRNMKRLEKLYLVTSEAPAIASAPPSIISPYREEIAQLRRQRLRLEEEHLQELNRLTTLERVRGPKPKWYELKDSQFHFEAGKNNELLRTQDRWNATLKSRSLELSQSQPDLSTLHMRSASFS
ncbi:uncharacterized protein LOC143283150 [Babylonia areolata]|uniref:uncharacterized protein LOC143283150 n=1 Tax=Babylonia areolata TaxID=304850 RepID=UPI003FD63F9D